MEIKHRMKTEPFAEAASPPADARSANSSARIVHLTFPCDPLALGYKLYSQGWINLQPGITVLTGCNGAGKSTLMRQLMYAVETQRENAVISHFDNLRDGGNMAREVMLHSNRTREFANLLIASEGESIRINVGEFIRKTGIKVSRTDRAKELWIFVDAADSGLSIDNVIDLKEGMDFIVNTETENGISVYVIISANAYEIARGENCVDVNHPNRKPMRFKDYEDYRKFILKSRKYRDSLYENKKPDDD